MNLNTQKLMIERLLSSPDVFSRCAGILSHEYFDPELKPVIKFIMTHHEKYNALPKMDYINAEYESELKPRTVDIGDIKFTCDEIEKFCQQSALYNAIMESGPDVTSGKHENFGKVLERVQKALAVAIQRDLGINMFDNVEARLRALLENQLYEPTGIGLLDTALGGGLQRKQVTMFSANSGGGKSLMMANIGANYARRGFHVLQLALELTEEMIYLRNIAILSGVKTTEWKENIAEITGTMKQHTEVGAGSFILKRIAGGSTANDIRSYLKQYELEMGHKPDVLIVDYLDLMSPNGGTKDKNISEQDKEKSEQLSEIAFDYDCIVMTASQQNRDGVRNANPDQAIIAGGISKINTVDNYISIYMNPEMRLKGELFLYYLKTRSSAAVGSSTHLAFNPDNLIISDKKGTTASVIQAIMNRKKNREEKVIFPGENGGTMNIPDEMADIIGNYIEQEEQSLNKTIKEVLPPEQKPLNLENDDALWEKQDKPKFIVKPIQNNDREDLMSLMQSFT